MIVNLGLLFFFFTCTISVTPTVGQSIGYPPKRFVTKKYATIHGRRMAYVEVGQGDPIVFLHDNPASSYKWRNVMPHVEGLGRLIAVDMIGMGDSNKLPPTDPSRYIIPHHMNYIYGLLEHIGVKERVTFVGVGWGNVFGTNWAYLKRRDPNAVKGIAIIEPVLKDFNETIGSDSEHFEFIRSPAGQKENMEKNLFIERYLQDWMIRKLTKKELDEYRRPFRTPGEPRRAMAFFPSQLLYNGQPRSTFLLFRKLRRWLAVSKVPKLIFNPSPGFLTPAVIDEMRTWPNVKEVKCRGVVFAPEDDPDVIGKSIAMWLKTL